MSRPPSFVTPTVLLGFALLAFSGATLAQPKTVKKSSPAIPWAMSTSMGMSDEQMTDIPYFCQSDGMKSLLTLNNNSLHEQEVEVTVFNLKGRALRLDRITLTPTSITDFKLEELTKDTGRDFDSGNIQIKYHGRSMEVTAQVGVFSSEKRISFESRESDMMEFRSSKLNGIIWLPHTEAEAFVAITNIASRRVKASILIGAHKREISLGPRETRLLKLNQDVEQLPPTSALLKLQHSGAPGEVIATGFVRNLTNGYSSTFQLVDPAASQSSRLAGAHVVFGFADLSAGFSPDTKFRAPLLLANVGMKPVTARVSVDYTEAGTPANLAINEIRLGPAEVKEIELSEELAQRGIIGPVDDAGVDVEYDGEPGSVIGHLTSEDQSGDFSFEVPIKDPIDTSHSAGNSNPWTLEGDAKTVLHLKNTTGSPASALVQFRYADGTYNPDRVQLRPYQTVSINVQKLKDSGKADIRGQIFPEHARIGQVIWMEETPGSIIGRAEQVNVKTGTVRSFSCGNCPCPPQPTGTSCSPNSYQGPVGDTVNFTNLYTTQDCAGVSYGPYQGATPYSWQSSPSSVATVNSGGLVTCMAQGTATVSGLFYNYVYTGQSCSQQQITQASQCPVTVCQAPNSASTTLTDPLSLTSVYPNLLTGIGNVARVTVGPSGTVWDGKNVTEAVSSVPGANTCPSGVPNACSGATTFQIGAGYQPAVREGNNIVPVGPLLVATSNQFFDQYTATSNVSWLDYYHGGTSCKQTCSQQYYNTCTQPQKIFDHTFTYTFSKSTISGTRVTLVTLSE